MDQTDLLAGVRVVDFTRYLPGPACTLHLAWLGAHVDVVEQPPDGDPMRAVPPFGDDGVSLASASLGRGKQRHLLDLGSAEGQAAALELVAQADVVVEGFRPGVADRLGIGHAALREQFPGLVVCAITGYGQTGPWAQRAGHDANYLAVTGLLEKVGTPSAGPHLPPVPLADLAGGSMAATAICAALVRRARTGEGATIDVSLAEAALAWQAHSLPGAETFDGARGVGLLNGGLSSYDVYACAEGHVAVGPIEPKFFGRLCELLELPAELAAAQYDMARQDEVRDVFATRFAERPAEAWADLLEGEETCVTRVLHASEVADHEQHIDRGALDEIQPGVFAPRAPWLVDGRRSGS